MNKIVSSATSRATAILAIITVAIILAFAALLTLPLPLQAQTTITLVSNAAEGNRSLISSDIHAQRFTTGPDVLGYFISTVELNLQNAAGRNIAVMLKENNSSNRPGNLLETLTNPAPLVSSSVNTFTVPNDRTLDPNTTYWITINEGVSGAKAQVRSRTENTETSAYGWTIGNTRLFKSSLNSNWTSVTSSFVQLVVRGTVRTASTDATLSDLALEDGSANEITLTPPFVTGTKSYTALVENSVSSITLTPTVNNANATVEYLDASDASITDTDTSTPALDAPLAVLDNTFKVKVTAEAGSTNTDTYTVVVTREAQAQSLTTFVTNTGGSGITDSDRFQAQSFETGANEGGYTVSQVDILLGDVSGKSTSVSIKEDNGGEPGNLVTTLTNPGTLTSNQFNTFTAPDIITLDANTTYWLTVNEGISSDRVFVSSKPADDELSFSGWGIGDGSLHRTSEMDSWSNSTSSLMMEILGTTSTDATLSDLALEEGGGNEITLTPPFVTGTKSYTALVENSVSSITLTPTVNNANATVEYLDASDASITDTDTSTPALDAPLAVLDNTFKVKVTAEAGSTNTDTYTVVVTREAQAVDTHVLVSNTGQPKKSTFAHTPHAQRFVTGAAADEFIISEVQIQLAVAAGKDTTITIKENTTSDRPGNLVATLTNPATLTSNSLNTFTAPAGTTLAANTSYWITVNEGFTEQDGVSFPITDSNAQTGEAGWSIDDRFLWKIAHTTSWYVAQESLLIAIRGTAAVSTDATLSDLTLADVDSKPVALNPAFESATVHYTASVPHSTDSVTLAATKNDSNATAAITDDDDTSTPDEAQLALVVGPNTLTVTVTAEDGSTTRTYTVTVTRAPEPGRVLVSKKVLTITEGSSGHYTLVLDRQPTTIVTVAPTGHVGTEVTLVPAAFVFDTWNWDSPQTVTVTAGKDANTTNETITLTHLAFSGDSRYNTITIDSVTVNVDDTEAPNYHLRSIRVPYDLALGEKALPEEEINVWTGYPFYQNMYVVAVGDRWSPTGVWADPEEDMIWVVDPIHFGVHALKLSALKDGRVERHIAAGTTEFDYRFNYNCHFGRTRASGDHGNPALTEMWGDDDTIWVVNDESGQLDAYSRDGSNTSGCYTDNVTGRDTNGTAVTARENFKTPFTRNTSKDYLLPQAGYGRLLVWGIWSNATKIWVGGPGGIYNIDLSTGQTVKAPGFNGHNGGTNGLWSDGRTMWVASRAWLRAYELDTGNRHAAFDVRLHGNLEPDGIWSDGDTIWVTHRSGSIEAYRLPTGTATVSQATEADPLTASFASAPETHDGENGFTFRIAFSEDVEITPEDMRDHALLVTGGTVTDTQRVDDRKDLWELTVEPAGSGAVSILVHSGRACTETGALCTADGRSLTSALALRVPGPQAVPTNSAATGAPTISGTAQVGETLTASTLGIADDDGLTNVSYNYQWVRNDGTSNTDIQDATGSTHTLVEADEDQTIRVKVSFADDADNEETLTSEATAEVAAATPTDPPGKPSNLTGTANADGTVTLSWDAPDDDSVTGYQILRRRPSEGENTLLVHVNDTGITATQYTDNDVTPDVRHTYRVKAINAVGISKWSNYVRVTPTQPAEPSQNSPATGTPTIIGTAQVGETLTADTSAIVDDDGLANATFTYQWLADDTAITGQTGITYTLVEAKEGQTIKVQVSFTDDAGNAETLTSAATATVAARPNTPATGAPAIDGTVQVGETLTVATLGIADDDGLNNVTYTYQWTRNDGSSDTVIQNATDSTYTLAAADEGQTIRVEVSFTDDAGNGESLTSAATGEVAAGAPTEPPGKPRNLTGTANADGTVTLSWNAPDDDSVTGYQILRRSPTLGEEKLLIYVNNTNTTATEYTDSNVVPNERYAYRVKAINAAGLSGRSDFVTVTPM